jgi:hypothetical protein
VTSLGPWLPVRHRFVASVEIAGANVCFRPIADIVPNCFLGAVFLFLAIAVLAVPAALLTAVIAVLVSRTRIASTAPFGTFIVIGTAIPLLMVVYGFYLSWPWPWYQPDAMQDGIPPGPWLLTASLPSWLLCLASSRMILMRRDERYRGGELP